MPPPTPIRVTALSWSLRLHYTHGLDKPSAGGHKGVALCDPVVRDRRPRGDQHVTTYSFDVAADTIDEAALVAQQMACSHGMCTAVYPRI